MVPAPVRGFLVDGLLLFSWGLGSRCSWRHRLPRPYQLTCRTHAPARGRDFRAWVVGVASHRCDPSPWTKPAIARTALPLPWSLSLQSGPMSPLRGGCPRAAPCPAAVWLGGCWGGD